MALITDLKVYYKLDGNSNDAVGSNNGTDTNIIYGTSYGKINQGSSFNGTSSYIVGSSAMNLSNHFTLSFWMKPTTLKNWGDPLCFDTLVDFKATFVTYADGHMYFDVGNGSSWGNAVTPPAGTFSNGNWYHIVGTGDGTNIKLYINGSYYGQASNSNTINDKIVIGSRVKSGYYFDGLIDEVGAWNRTLSSDEISELYNNGDGLQYPFNTSNFLQFF